MDNVEPKIVRVLEKVSSTIDKNEERCEETDRKDQHEMEWKQVALVIGNISTTNIKHLTISNIIANIKLKQYFHPSGPREILYYRGQLTKTKV